MSRFALLVCLALGLALRPTAAAAADSVWPELAKPPAALQRDGAADAALIVAIETYRDLPAVPGAGRNAVDWFKFFDAKGVSDDRIAVVRDKDATREAILAKLDEIAAKVAPDGTLWLIFVGHGAPSPSGDDGLLLGSDTQQTADSLKARSVSQSELLGKIAGASCKQAVVVMDACFSGRHGAGGALVPGLQPVIVAKARPKAAGITVLSAGAPDQFAGPLPGANRPAFSYLVLGALRGWADDDRNGAVTAQEAVRHARKVLTILPLGRTQRPELSGPDATLAAGGTEPAPDLSHLEAPVATQPPAQAQEPADPRAGLTEDARKLYDAEACGVQVRAGKPALFCGKDLVSQDEFVRRYAKRTGKRDLERFDPVRNKWRFGLLGGSVAVFSASVYYFATQSDDPETRDSELGLRIGAGFGVIFGGSFAGTSLILLAESTQNDGKPGVLDDDFDIGEARRAAREHNQALARKLRSDFSLGAWPDREPGPLPAPLAISLAPAPGGLGLRLQF